MKSFKVTTNSRHKDLHCNDIMDVLTEPSVPHFYKEDITVTELPEIQQPKMVRMGILQLPEGFLLSKTGATHVLYNGTSVNLTSYPELELLCDKDHIWMVIDWESIPVGSLVEVQCNHGGDPFYGKFDKVDCGVLHLRKGYSAPTSVIKSVRIIEGPKAEVKV